jgi:phytol kinase
MVSLLLSLLLNGLTGFNQPTLIVQVGAVALWLGAVVLVAGWRIKQGSESELIRKIIHIGTGNVILLAWWLQIPAWVGIGASILFSLVTLLSYQFPLIPGIDSVGRKSLGTFFYAVSIGVLITCFWQSYPYCAVLGVLIMTWGDGFAALIGQRWGKHHYLLWGVQKSWEGSLAMLLISAVVCSLVLFGVYGYAGQIWIIALGVALIATVLEAFSKLGIDNLTVPLGSAAIAFWLSQMLLR